MFFYSLREPPPSKKLVLQHWISYLAIYQNYMQVSRGMDNLNTNELMKVLEYLQVSYLWQFLRLAMSSDFISKGRK